MKEERVPITIEQAIEYEIASLPTVVLCLFTSDLCHKFLASICIKRAKRKRALYFGYMKRYGEIRP